MMKSEHTQTVSQLTSQNEVLRNSFRDQVRHLQEEHRKTVETLQQQLSRVEAQLFQLKNEPTTRSMYVHMEILVVQIFVCLCLLNTFFQIHKKENLLGVTSINSVINEFWICLLGRYLKHLNPSLIILTEACITS